MKKEELVNFPKGNYIPKGELEGFPKEIIARMLDCQEEQGNPRDVSVFERNIIDHTKGFTWDITQEDWQFWHEVIDNKEFNRFFERYPKKDQQDNSQEFKVGDKVIDVIRGRRGKVTYIDTLNNDSFCIFVDFNNKETAAFTLDGKYCSIDKYPRLLHYRDDYDYSIINFNNLPKRQEPKRWRAKVEEVYYFVSHDFTSAKSRDYRTNYDNECYEAGNYFKTKEKAQEIAGKLKEYFNQLIKKEHE